MKLTNASLLITIFCCLLVACSSDRNHMAPMPTGPEPLPLAQGINGTVEFWEGDFMPVAVPDTPSGSVRPVSRTIFFFEPTGRADVVRDGYGSFFLEIQTELIDTVRSDSEGRFAISLPSGLYSVFVREGDRYYANGSSDQHIQPVQVVEGQVLEARIKIDYLATY